jgi:hypothetical protein
MTMKVDERMLRLVLPALAAALFAPLPHAAIAQENTRQHVEGDL